MRDGCPSQFELFQLYFKFELHLIVDILIPECLIHQVLTAVYWGPVSPSPFIAPKLRQSVKRLSSALQRTILTAMQQPKSATVLRVGAAIEVLWQLNEQNKPRLVWWPARIQKICFRGAAGDMEGNATIEYESQFGFERSTCAVNLIKGQVLVERCPGSRDAQRHKWRTLSEQLTSSSNHAENNVANGCRPTPEQTEADAYNAESSLLREKNVCEGHEGLLGRVRDLERALYLLQKDAASRNLEAEKHFRSGTSALRFATFRLGEALEQNLLHSRPRGEKHSNIVRADYITVQADCALDEFRHIAKYVYEALPSEVQFEPSLHETQSPAMTSKEFEIRFSSYKSLCIALGVSPEAAVSTILTQKVDKNNPGSCLLRVIGSLVGGENNVTDGSPMALAVGRSIIEQEDGTQKVQTLFRSSMEWDEVDKCYAAPLHARQLLISELTSMQKCRALALVESGASSTKGKDLRCFSIRWIRSSKVSNPAAFQESRYGDVFGVLETCVPCAIFKGKAGCEEALRICTRDFFSFL